MGLKCYSFYSFVFMRTHCFKYLLFFFLWEVTSSSLMYFFVFNEKCIHSLFPLEVNCWLEGLTRTCCRFFSPLSLSRPIRCLYLVKCVYVEWVFFLRGFKEVGLEYLPLPLPIFWITAFIAAVGPAGNLVNSVHCRTVSSVKPFADSF